MLLQRRHMLREITARQDAAMYFRMQGLDTAVEHFRETGVIRHFGHLDAIVSQQFSGAARRQDIHAQRRQFFCEIKYPGFIGYGNEGLFNHDENSGSE